MKKNLKFILTILLIIVVSVISLIVMIFNYKDTKNENKTNDIKDSTEMVIKNLNDENLDDVISTELNNNNKIKTRNCAILSKYSENYESVVKWMIDELCNNMNKNGFDVVEINDENEEWDEVDGLKKYGSAEKYITECINNGIDISELFLSYCPKEYEALKNTYLLGKDKNKEYDEGNSNTLYNSLLDLYTKREYQQIVDKVENLIKTYKLTLPYNYKICNIYQDAKSSIEYGDNTDAINYGLSYLKLPETYFSNFMKLTTKQKLSLVEDTSSIVPYVNTNINIISVDDVDLNANNWLVTRYSNVITEDTIVEKITYYETNEDDTYETYIANTNGKINILSITYTGNGTCKYNTIDKLNELNK